MMKFVPLLLIVVRWGTAVNFRKAFPAATTNRKLSASNETQNIGDTSGFNELFDAYKYTTGYLRTDVIDWMTGVWSQAQVLPVGVCFQYGFNGGSANMEEVLISELKVARVTAIYEAANCSGAAVARVPYFQPRVESNDADRLERRSTHVSDLEAAVGIPHGNSGLLVK